MARDELGYYPYYEPNCEAVFQKENMAEGEDMGSLYAKEDGENLAGEEELGEAEGEDMESLYAEKNEGETLGARYSEGESLDSGYSSDIKVESVDAGLSQDSSLSQ